MEKIEFDDLYIQRDYGVLWRNSDFETEYNDNKGIDNGIWSLPYEDWKKVYARYPAFVKLEQFLENNWFGIRNSIEETHPGFINLFQNRESKSEIFLNFVCLFDDLDRHFSETLSLDMENIRDKSPIEIERISESLKNVRDYYYEKFPNVDEAYLVVDKEEKNVKCVWNNFDVDTGKSSMDIYTYSFESLVKRSLSEKNIEYARLIDWDYDADKKEEVVDLWKVDSIITKDAILIHDGNLYNHILLKDVIKQIPKQEYRKTKNRILEEQGKTLDYHDFGKIIRDKVDEAIDGEEYCWYVGCENDYSEEDWKEFEEDLKTLTLEQSQCIEFGDDPYVTFYGDFIKLFEEDKWLLENDVYQYWCKDDMEHRKIEFKDTEFAKKMAKEPEFREMAVQDFIKRTFSELKPSSGVKFYDNGVILELDGWTDNNYLSFSSVYECLKYLDKMVKNACVQDYDYKIGFIENAMSLEKEKEHFVLHRADASNLENDRAILLYNVINQLETSQDLLREYLKEDNLVFEGSLSETECQIEDIDRSIEGLYDLADDLGLDLETFKSKSGIDRE